MSFFDKIFGSKSQKTSAVKILDSEAFKNAISKGNVQLIDVRTPEEYNNAHIGSAKNIDFYSGKFNVEFNKLDKELAIYIYCKSGNRSKQTADKLSNMGFMEIYDLQGGILNYN